jgi:hypothetical protein
MNNEVAYGLVLFTAGTKPHLVWLENSRAICGATPHLGFTFHGIVSEPTPNTCSNCTDRAAQAG